MRKKSEIVSNNANIVDTREHFNLFDALKMFVYALLIPQVAMFLATELAVLVTNLFSGYNPNVDKNPAIVVFVNIIGNLTFLLLVFLYVRRNKINLLSASKINKKVKTSKVTLSIFLGIIAFACSLLFVNYCSYLFGNWFNYYPTNTYVIPLDNAWGFIGSIVALGILPAICEELLFRGVIYSGLREKFKVAGAVTLCALLFMLGHGNLNQTIYQFCMGAVLALVYEFTDNLIYPIIVHMASNITSITTEFILTLTIGKLTIDYTLWWIILLSISLFILGIILAVVFVYVFRKINTKSEDYRVERHMIRNEIIFLVIGLVIGVGLWLAQTLLTIYGMV